VRFPKRLQALGLGVLALAASPLIAALWTTSAMSSTASHAVAAVSPALSQSMQAQVRAERSVEQPFMLKVHAPAPTPPPPTPAPTPAPRPRVQPAAAPSAPSAPVDPSSVEGIIRAAADRHGVSGDWMVRIARCESGLRPNAYNPRGPYIGLFQFLESTFRANGGTNIYDAADQSEVAATMLSHGQAHQWSCA
jgi:hypothetical protein